MATGTFSCPICGFDLPHTHDARTVAWHRDGDIVESGRHWGPLNNNQRKGLREQAANEHRVATLRAEFEASPRAYVSRYGSVNSAESSYLIGWLLARIDKAEVQLAERDALRDERDALRDERDAARADVERLRNMLVECGTNVDSLDTCGVCRLHFADCELDVHTHKECGPWNPEDMIQTCPGARARALLAETAPNGTP